MIGHALSNRLTFTRQHFQKLRKESKAEFGDLGGAEKATPAKAITTPGKAKTTSTNGTASNKSTSKRKGRKAAAELNGENDEESPSKKRAVGADEVTIEEFS